IDEDAWRRERLLSDPDLARAGEAGVALVDRDIGVAPQSPLDAARGEAEHVVFALLDLLHVDTDGTLDPDAVLAGAPSRMGGIGAGDQRLGRRAAGVDAGPAEAMALDNGNAHSCARQAVRQGGPGLAGADNDRIERLHARTPSWLPASAGHHGT